MARSQTFLLLLVCLSLGFSLIIPFFDKNWFASASDTRYEYNDNGATAHMEGIQATTRWAAQSFTIGQVGTNVSQIPTSIKLYLQGAYSSYSATLNVSIRNTTWYAPYSVWKPSTQVYTSAQKTITMTATATWYEFTGLTPQYTLQKGGHYAIVIRTTASPAAYVYVLGDNTGDTYLGPNCGWFTSNSGTTWNMEHQGPNYDFEFYEYGILPVSVPTLTSNATTSISTTSAQLNGYLSNNGGATTTVGFWYGTSSPPGTKYVNGTCTAPKTFYHTVTGLSPRTKYYVRAYGNNRAGTTNGSILSFYTLGSWTTKQSGYNLFSNQAVWLTKQSGYNTFGNTASWVTKTSGWNTFLNAALWTNKQSGWNTFGSAVSFSNVVQGWSTFGNASAWSDIESGYNTFSNIPTWANIASGYNTFNNTPLFGNVSNGWNTFSNLSSWKDIDSGWNNFSNIITNWTTIDNGWNTFGNNVVRTDPATAIDMYTATLNGWLLDNGSNITVCGFWWDIGITPTGSHNVTVGVVGNNSAFSFNLASLGSNAVYYFEAWSLNGGFYKGQVLTFTTLGCPPNPGCDSTALVIHYNNHNVTGTTTSTYSPITGWVINVSYTGNYTVPPGCDSTALAILENLTNCTGSYSAVYDPITGWHVVNSYVGTGGSGSARFEGITYHLGLGVVITLMLLAFMVGVIMTYKKEKKKNEQHRETVSNER